MTTFLKKIFIFFLILSTIIGLLDYAISQRLKQSNTHGMGEYSVWNDIFSGNINSDVVIYGNSRAWSQFDVKLLENGLKKSIYNLGLDGHNFWLQYLRHKLLLKYNSSPQWIFMSIDCFILGKREGLYNSDQFLPYMLFDQEIKQYTSSYDGFKSIDYYVPLIRYAGNIDVLKQFIKSFLGENKILARRKGYRGVQRKWNYNFKQPSKYKVNIDSASVNLFEKFLADCQKQEINVVFVAAPVVDEGQEFVENRQEIISYFKNTAKKFTIPYLDYANDEMCSQKEYFYNGTHLTHMNKKGAELFTKKLINDLNESKVITIN